MKLWDKCSICEYIGREGFQRNTLMNIWVRDNRSWQMDGWWIDCVVYDGGFKGKCLTSTTESGTESGTESRSSQGPYSYLPCECPGWRSMMQESQECDPRMEELLNGIDIVQYYKGSPDLLIFRAYAGLSNQDSRIRRWLWPIIYGDANREMDYRQRPSSDQCYGFFQGDCCLRINRKWVCHGPFRRARSKFSWYLYQPIDLDPDTNLRARPHYSEVVSLTKSTSNRTFDLSLGHETMLACTRMIFGTSSLNKSLAHKGLYEWSDFTLGFNVGK
jgi:hypothetical protein